MVGIKLNGLIMLKMGWIGWVAEPSRSVTWYVALLLHHVASCDKVLQHLQRQM